MAEARSPSRASQRLLFAEGQGPPGHGAVPLALRGLERGLKQRQLDAIGFFLRSKETVFQIDNLPPSDLSSSQSDRPGVPGQGDDPQLDFVTSLMTLVFWTVLENQDQPQLMHFTQQLLHLAKEYLQKVTKLVIGDLQEKQVAGNCPESEQMIAEVRLTKLTDHIESVKGKMREIQEVERARSGSQGQRRPPQSTEERRLGCVLSDNQRRLVQLWDSLDKRALTVEGILNGEIPLLQKYLLRRYGREAADLTLIIEKGLEEGLAFIQDRDINNARNMFANMGFDPDSKLRQICLYTPDQILREYLISELQKAGTLSETEQQMVRFVHTLEKLYSCPSFDMAKVLKEEGQQRGRTPAIAWMQPTDLTFDLTTYSGEILPCDVANSETSSYAQVLLEWLRHWSPDQRDRIIIEQVISRKDCVLPSPPIQTKVIWDYLCCHLDVTRLSLWIQAQFPYDRQEKPKVAWPFNQPVTQEMLELSLRRCPVFVMEEITNDLARRGVFVPWEHNDLGLLVCRLSKISEVFTQPHLVEKYQTRHNVTLLDFHYHMIKYCVREKQPELLYMYLDHWRLCSEASTLMEVGLPSDSLTPWVAMLLHFRKAANLLYNPSAVFEASLSNSRVMQKINESSVFGMLEQGLVIRAIATLAYSPNDLQQIVSEASTAVIQMFMPHRQLQFALFGDRLKSVSPTAGITVYNLLETNAPFGVSRLFGWQSVHTQADDEAPQVIPHFSYEPLVAKYAHRESLCFSFYLKQGRPCYAFCAFLIDSLQSNSRALSWNRLHQACLHAFLLSIKYFTDPVVCAACCAFVEMLGVDSTSQRLHVEVLTVVYKYLCSELKGDMEHRREKEKIIEKELVNLVRQCLYKNHECQVKILAMLTAATCWSLDKHKLQRTSFEASLRWHIPALFSANYRLPMCDDFLRHCAADSNWVMFLSVAQTHQYPPNQVLDLVSLFASPNIREHLTCIVKSSVSQRSETNKQFASPRRKRRERADQRLQLYSKIGVSSDTQAGATASDDMEAEISTDDNVPSMTSTGDVSDQIHPVPYDLLSLLQSVQNHRDPAQTLCTLAVQLQNPVLAVLAACHQNHNPLQCLGSWLIASSPHEACNLLLTSCGDFVQFDWMLDTMAMIRNVLIGQSLEALLLRGFWIFQPESLLVAYLRYHTSVLHHADKTDCVQELLDFQKLYWKRRSVSSPESDIPQCPVLPITWMEESIAAIIQHFVETCHSMSVLETMLQCLDERSILRFFECKVLDVNTLLKLHNATKETGIQLDYVVLGDPDNTKFQGVCTKLLSTLQERKHFAEARLSAEVLGLPTDNIALKQLNVELSELETNPIWETKDIRSNFWSHCQDVLCRYRVNPELAANFFLDHSGQCNSHTEQAEVFKLVYDWLSQSEERDSLTEKKREIFIKMWTSKIHEYLETEDKLDGKALRAQLCKEQLLTFALRQLTAESSVREDPVGLASVERQALHVLVGRLLDHGDIQEAMRVVQNFGCENHDLDIVLNCLKLAKGLISPDRLNKDMKKVLAGPQPLRLRRISTSTTSFPRTISMVSVSSLMAQADMEEEGDDLSTLVTIQSLCQHCTHAKNCAAFILTVYKITLMLNQKFEWVLLLEDFALIHRILASQSENRYMLAKAYIVTSALDDTQVAGFLCDAIVEALQFSTGLIQQVSTSFGTDKPILLKPFLDPSGIGSGSSLRTNRGTGIQELIQMCQDPAVLGNRLLDTLTSMVSANAQCTRKRAMLTVEVELLIYANDCFTLSCHMEGISAVLKTARSLVQALLEAEEFLLMISLLTGIGRYSEMTYIFDVLKQNYQFELLFRKGIDRDSRLRLAILDYLQRSHPGDLDTYSMAALNFTMYREIGRMLEEEATKELRLLLPTPGRDLENSGANQAALKKAIRYYSDAAESYLKENCLRHAEGCVRQARLVALQSQLLGSKERVVHLDRDGIRNFVLKHKFYEAFIVCEAYSAHNFWSEALYQQGVKGGSSTYVQDLRHHIQLTPAVIWEVAERYRIEVHPTKTTTAQMKKVLGHCQEVKMTYKIAALLGFSDVIKEIKSDAWNEAILKDAGIMKS